ncbi:MAG: DUF4402 domain-containing protein [Cetobacterium sp.]
MKKILTLLSLTLSMTAFAADQATMEIKATVVKPLNVSHNGNIDFGTVIQNTTVRAENKLFTVSGTANQKVIFTMNGTPINQFTETELSKTGDNTKKMLVWLKDIKLSSADTLDGDGNLTWGFNAEMYIPEKQETGEYSGQLVARVTYQ